MYEVLYLFLDPHSFPLFSKPLIYQEFVPVYPELFLQFSSYLTSFPASQCIKSLHTQICLSKFAYMWFYNSERTFAV